MAKKFVFGTWYPIETAPKDGVLIDLWVSGYDDGCRISDCYWSVDDQIWWDTAGGGCVLEKPTHWMPLPPPPKDEAK